MSGVKSIRGRFNSSVLNLLWFEFCPKLKYLYILNVVALVLNRRRHRVEGKVGIEKSRTHIFGHTASERTFGNHLTIFLSTGWAKKKGATLKRDHLKIIHPF